MSKFNFALFLKKEKYEFLATTVRTLFDEDISNQFYTCLCVLISKYLFCFYLNYY